MVRARRGRKSRGNRGRGRRYRVPAVPSLNYFTATTGTTTTFSRSSFPIIAGCGDRSFKIVGLKLNVVSYSEPVLVQPHIYNQAGRDIGLGQYLVNTSKRVLNLRIPGEFKSFFEGITPQTQTLVTLVLLPTYKGQNIKVTCLLSALFRFGQPELLGKW